MEHILVVPTEAFHNVGYFQGFCEQPQRYLEELLQPQWMSFRPRDDMEKDPSFKQLIPYVIFRYRPVGAGPQLFCYTRGKGQGERRLHSKRSVGVGGHISSDDIVGSTHGNVYLTGMQRELDEEVRIDAPHNLKCVGLINDDETEVGTVHLGIVHICDVQEPHVFAREDDIAEASFMGVPGLLARLDEFESWSRICLEALFA